MSQRPPPVVFNLSRKTSWTLATFGWITTEFGRQPWVVYGLMRTADGVSPVPAPSVLASLVLFAQQEMAEA